MAGPNRISDYQRAVNRDLLQDGRGVLNADHRCAALDPVSDWRRVFDFQSKQQQQQRANEELQRAEPQLRGVLPLVGGIQPAMKRFNPAAGCPKCGSLQRDLEWKKADMRVLLIPEKLIVSCRVCGFVDTFAPLDGPAS